MRQVFRAIINIAAKPENYRFVFLCLAIVGASLYVAYVLAQMHMEHDRREHDRCAEMERKCDDKEKYWMMLYLDEVKNSTKDVEALRKKTDSLRIVNQILRP